LATPCCASSAFRYRRCTIAGGILLLLIAIDLVFAASISSCVIARATLCIRAMRRYRSAGPGGESRELRLRIDPVPIQRRRTTVI
jgi:hypothetical protein